MTWEIIILRGPGLIIYKLTTSHHLKKTHNCPDKSCLSPLTSQPRMYASKDIMLLEEGLNEALVANVNKFLDKMFGF